MIPPYLLQQKGLLLPKIEGSVLVETGKRVLELGLPRTVKRKSKERSQQNGPNFLTPNLDAPICGKNPALTQLHQGPGPDQNRPGTCQS